MVNRLQSPGVKLHREVNIGCCILQIVPLKECNGTCNNAIISVICPRGKECCEDHIIAASNWMQYKYNQTNKC